MQAGDVLVAANKVLDRLGGGLTEHIYKAALAHEIRQTHRLVVEEEVCYPVRYLGAHVGHVRADLLVDGTTVIETKTTAKICESHLAQVGAYLRLHTANNGGECVEGFVVNFGLKGQLPVQLETVTSV